MRTAKGGRTAAGAGQTGRPAVKGKRTRVISSISHNLKRHIDHCGGPVGGDRLPRGRCGGGGLERPRGERG